MSHAHHSNDFFTSYLEIACEQNNFSCEFVTLRWDAMMVRTWCTLQRNYVSSRPTGNNNSPITPFAAPIIGHT
jgi:hypothetical protein